MSINVKRIIKKKLNTFFNPKILKILDESRFHKNHKINDYNFLKNKKKHFRIIIISDYFYNQSIIERHKCIYKVLKLEIKKYIHSISIKANTIKEYNNF